MFYSDQTTDVTVVGVNALRHTTMHLLLTHTINRYVIVLITLNIICGVVKTLMPKKLLSALEC